MSAAPNQEQHQRQTIEALTARVKAAEERAAAAEATLGRQTVQLDQVATSWSRATERATRRNERLRKMAAWYNGRDPDNVIRGYEVGTHLEEILDDEPEPMGRW